MRVTPGWFSPGRKDPLCFCTCGPFAFADDQNGDHEVGTTDEKEFFWAVWCKCHDGEDCGDAEAQIENVAQHSKKLSVKPHRRAFMQ